MYSSKPEGPGWPQKDSEEPAAAFCAVAASHPSPPFSSSSTPSPRLTLMQKAAMRVRERQRQGLYSESLSEFKFGASPPKKGLLSALPPSPSCSPISQGLTPQRQQHRHSFGGPGATRSNYNDGRTARGNTGTNDEDNGNDNETTTTKILLGELLSPPRSSTSSLARRRLSRSDPLSAIEVKRQLMTEATPLSPKGRRRSSLSVPSANNNNTNTSYESVASAFAADDDDKKQRPLKKGHSHLGGAHYGMGRRGAEEKGAPPPCRGMDVVPLSEEEMRQHSGYSDNWSNRIAHQHEVAAKIRAIHMLRRTLAALQLVPQEEIKQRADTSNEEKRQRRFLWELFTRRLRDLRWAESVRRTVWEEVQAVPVKRSQALHRRAQEYKMMGEEMRSLFANKSSPSKRTERGTRQPSSGGERDVSEHEQDHCDNGLINQETEGEEKNGVNVGGGGPDSLSLYLAREGALSVGSGRSSPSSGSTPTPHHNMHGGSGVPGGAVGSHAQERGQQQKGNSFSRQPKELSAAALSGIGGTVYDESNEKRNKAPHEVHPPPHGHAASSSLPHASSSFARTAGRGGRVASTGDGAESSLSGSWSMPHVRSSTPSPPNTHKRTSGPINAHLNAGNEADGKTVGNVGNVDGAVERGRAHSLGRERRGQGGSLSRAVTSTRGQGDGGGGDGSPPPSARSSRAGSYLKSQIITAKEKAGDEDGGGGGSHHLSSSALLLNLTTKTNSTDNKDPPKRNGSVATPFFDALAAVAGVSGENDLLSSSALDGALRRLRAGSVPAVVGLSEHAGGGARDGDMVGSASSSLVVGRPRGASHLLVSHQPSSLLNRLGPDAFVSVEGAEKYEPSAFDKALRKNKNNNAITMSKNR